MDGAASRTAWISRRRATGEEGGGRSEKAGGRREEGEAFTRHTLDVVDRGEVAKISLACFWVLHFQRKSANARAQP